MKSIKKISLFTVLLLLAFQSSKAQFIKEKSIVPAIGYGVSIPYDDMDNAFGTGFLAQAELNLKVKSWFDLRPYAGFFITNASDEDLDGNPTNSIVESKAFFLGGKFRLRAPIPYVAPFLELGVGTSIGQFTTQTFNDNIDKSGVFLHVPFSLGLELGKNHNVELALTYYIHESLQQAVGAFAVGVVFPLKS